MIPPTLTAASTTQKVDPKLLDFLRNLFPGERIRITQWIRVGSRRWSATIEGKFRDINFLETGLATQRVPEDAIVVPALHFTKDNGELSCVTLDENSRVEKVS